LKYFSQQDAKAMTTENNPYTPSATPSQPVRFGGMLRVAEIYSFIMLIRGSIGTLTGSCTLIFHRPASEMAATGLSGQPVTPVLLISYAFALASFLGFGIIILRFLRVASRAARNKIRAILAVLASTFALLGAVAFSLPEPTSGVLVPWTESQAFKLGSGQFVDSAFALLVLLLFTVSNRAKSFYSDADAGPSAKTM